VLVVPPFTFQFQPTTVLLLLLKKALSVPEASPLAIVIPSASKEVRVPYKSSYPPSCKVLSTLKCFSLFSPDVIV